MARIAYVPKRFSDSNAALILDCNNVITRYMQKGLRLSLRQLYYQLVSTNAIPNTVKSYKRLSAVVSDARLAGLIDWDALVDRGRQPRIPSEFSGPAAFMSAVTDIYRLHRRLNQDTYVEVAVEKDALSEVLGEVCADHHVPLYVNKGYTSQSAMYEWANRVKFQTNRIRGTRLRFAYKTPPRHAVILYFGDHDPSGEDMVRDIQDRMVTFGVHNVTVEKVALTWAQIQQYNPPPNPAKMTDPRAAAYVAEHGGSSWELDALDPDVLQQLLKDALDAYTDQARIDELIAQEDKHKERLMRAADEIEDEESA